MVLAWRAVSRGIVYGAGLTLTVSLDASVLVSPSRLANEEPLRAAVTAP